MGNWKTILEHLDIVRVDNWDEGSEPFGLPKSTSAVQRNEVTTCGVILSQARFNKQQVLIDSPAIYHLPVQIVPLIRISEKMILVDMVDR